MSLFDRIFRPEEAKKSDEALNHARTLFQTLTAYQPVFTSWGGAIYESEVVRAAIDTMTRGINGQQFNEIATSLKTKDPYMALADFDSYQKAQAFASEAYKDVLRWNKMSLYNISGAGIFSADRSVEDYAREIWCLSK